MRLSKKPRILDALFFVVVEGTEGSKALVNAESFDASLFIIAGKWESMADVLTTLPREGLGKSYPFDWLVTGLHITFTADLCVFGAGGGGGVS